MNVQDQSSPNSLSSQTDQSMIPVPATAVPAPATGPDVHREIHIIFIPVSEPTLPVGPGWGNDKGTLPLIVNKIQQDPIDQLVCPHCQQEVGEKSLYFNIDDNRHFHRACRGELTMPASPERDAELALFKKTWGIGEGLYREVYDSEYPLLVRTDKPAVLVNCGVITEALAKSVEERIHRRTRIDKLGPKDSEGGVVIKKSADNDPCQTSKGRSNFRGTRKAGQDAKKRRVSKRFEESANFIHKTYNKSADIIIEQAGKLQDPLCVLEVLTKLTSDKIDNGWIEDAKRMIVTVLEGRDFRRGPYTGMINHAGSMTHAKSALNENLERVKKFFPQAWVERRTDLKQTIAQYYIFGQRGSRYDIALQRGLVETT